MTLPYPCHMNRISISVWQKFVSMYTLLRVIEQCCFNSVPDLFNGQTVDFILKPPKVVESRTYVNNMKQHCSITLTIGLVVQLMQMQPGVHRFFFKEIQISRIHKCTSL